MIKSTTYHPDWIFELRSRLGRKYDPKLIEKVVYALTFLEQLKVNKLDFIFKGGTALLLATEEPKRFSIDIDIITEENQKGIEAILDKISKEEIFTHWEDDNDRKHTPDAPIGHYKMYYDSAIDGKNEPILLDLLFAPNPYPELMQVPISHNWIETQGEPILVNMPTFDSILGDKLTAFAPQTTGILYTKNRPVEIIKQLFDVAFLMDNLKDLPLVRKSYLQVVAEEIGFRKLDIEPIEVLEDTQQNCFTLSTRDKSEAFNHLQTGITNFTNFTLIRFNIDEAIIAAAKVAYLSEILKREGQSIERYNDPMDIKDWLIELAPYNRLNKLKKSNPEAFFYWYKVIVLYQQQELVLSQTDTATFNTAYSYYRSREGNFSTSDPIIKVQSKIKENCPFVGYNRNELSLMLKVIDENIAFMQEYEYVGLDFQTSVMNKRKVLEPLSNLRTRVKYKIDAR
ncbi:nucleotidyl transferase AbiEii/AbiGii toxin family protein [Flagellimonas meridianipacifica]|uniref:Nucleotidyltransferase AbiEii toxin of type IV toxin-antitoxin system n=1 Tax=Flagellimonas meridianipacifica TaxID=1080225 RepID=A0A2T0MIG4_9FLAO|nr:nucleotidyl transferase AbiEii/AbiGii toxin family protein [Allomuricauda pacifica]PRX57371.1 nucleotidyltransferase AbiEii toxin of type IV toxin-antitoxin system [Allomuricauda pacifica]